MSDKLFGDAAELREALEMPLSKAQEWHWGLITAAARARLAQLEADPELVYRIAKALADIAGFEWHAFKYEAEAVLAAISTPTPVEELNGH